MEMPGRLVGGTLGHPADLGARRIDEDDFIHDPSLAAPGHPQPA